MVLAEPDLILIAAIEPLDQFQILFQRQSRVDPGLMEWRKEDAEAHPVHNLSLPLFRDNPQLDRRSTRASPDTGMEASIFRQGDSH